MGRPPSLSWQRLIALYTYALLMRMVTAPPRPLLMTAARQPTVTRHAQR